MDGVYTIEEIRSVILNQSGVPDYLLNAYDVDSLDKSYLFDLLVLIIAKAQGVEEPGKDFTEFVAKNATSWRRWVILAKHYRKWEESLNPLRPISVPVNGDGIF